VSGLFSGRDRSFDSTALPRSLKLYQMNNVVYMHCRLPICHLQYHHPSVIANRLLNL
jgi:hypothetical protein